MLATPNDEQVRLEKNKRRGGFDNVSRISQNLKLIAHSAASWNSMQPFQREGIDMILHKLARLLAGDSQDRGEWVDVEGYAKCILVEYDRLQAAQAQQAGVIAGAGGAAGLGIGFAGAAQGAVYGPNDPGHHRV